MSKKKTIFFAAAAFMLAATFIATPKAKAEGLAPGEGIYAGAFLGLGMGILQADVDGFTSTNADTGEVRPATSFETDRGGLGLSGIQGGVWMGWGMKTADDIYFGAEVTALGSDEKIELNIAPGIKSGETEATGGTITSISAQRTWSAGGALRLGYYVNNDTLFAIKGGVAVSEFDVDIGSSSEQYYAGGPQMGASVETKLAKVDPNLSLRMEAVYTNYLTADILGQAGVGRSTGGTGHDSQLTGHDMAGRIGVQYSF
jgi:hypothetical protein